VDIAGIGIRLSAKRARFMKLDFVLDGKTTLMHPNRFGYSLAHVNTVGPPELT
jgi:hypothetical protein